MKALSHNNHDLHHKVSRRLTFYFTHPATANVSTSIQAAWPNLGHTFGHMFLSQNGILRINLGNPTNNTPVCQSILSCRSCFTAHSHEKPQCRATGCTYLLIHPHKSSLRNTHFTYHELPFLGFPHVIMNRQQDIMPYVALTLITGHCLT